MSAKTPSPLLHAFLAANNARDVSALLACFSGEAVVRDEGRGHAGKPAIKAWFEEVSHKYRFTLKATAAESRGVETILTVLVAGEFEGSPIPLHYHLIIANDKISALNIAG
jgi:ketosteroid isomerase-like protein